MIAKWLARKPAVLILDEPTKGIDVGAKAAVHAVTSEFARAGNGVILISSELPEILGMSDRVLVMRRGRLRGEFTRARSHQRKPAARRERRMMSAPIALVRGGAPRSEAGAAHAGAARGRDVRVPGLRDAAQSRRACSTTRRSSSCWRWARCWSSWCAASTCRWRPTSRCAACSPRCSIAPSRKPASLPVLLLTLVAGGLLGAFNGLLVWKLRLPPIVVTLGTMSVYRGVIYLLSQRRLGQRKRNVARLPGISRARNSSGSRRWPGWRSSLPRRS